jgi:inosine-uridine nucleoside N-ribohydrolase
MTIPVLIDTDMAVDDWMALAYLLQRDDVEIRAITVTADTDAACQAAVRNAMSITALAGKPDIPVATGRAVPLHANGLQPGWRERIDTLLGIELPEGTGEKCLLTAAELAQRVLAAPGDKPVLLTLGPLTNIAELLTYDRGAAGRIEMTYIMGGAVDVPGNLVQDIASGNDTAEWNIFLHPPAAAAVMASSLPITLIPLDATNTAPLTQRFYDELGADKRTPIARFIHEVLTREKASINAGDWYFWDPLAAVAITHPEIVEIEEIPIRIITVPGREDGRTKRDPQGHPVRVAMRADAELFEYVFLGALNGRQL